MSAPRKIWVDYERDMFSFEVDEPTSGRPTAYHHDDVVRELVEALEEQVAFYAMDLAMRRQFLEQFEIDDIEYRRDRARAALSKIAQEG